MMASTGVPFASTASAHSAPKRVVKEEVSTVNGAPSASQPLPFHRRTLTAYA
ncbi:hypothetical protein D3C83_246000 [compost metagenome]